MNMPPPPAAVTGGARPHPRGTVVLVLGIVSLFFAGIILGPIAIVMGNNALREIDASPGSYTNRSTVNAGRILGFVALALNILVIVAVLSTG